MARGQLQKHIIHGVSLARSLACPIAPLQLGGRPLWRTCASMAAQTGGRRRQLSTAERLGTLAPPHDSIPPIFCTLKSWPPRWGIMIQRSCSLTIHLTALPSLRRVSAGARTIPVRRSPRPSASGIVVLGIREPARVSCVVSQWGPGGDTSSIVEQHTPPNAQGGAAEEHLECMPTAVPPDRGPQVRSFVRDA